ncbi:MAG: DUF1573 domain-containing protein [Saprospiraceae bacterium]
MKNTILYLSILCIVLASSCNVSKKAAKIPEKVQDPYMTFDNPNHDFGTIKAGEQKTHIYTFTNTHKSDITLELVSGCDCTTLIYDEGKTYKPGEQGTIKATFDSNKEEERGELNKTIDILLANVNPETGYQIIKEVRYKLDLVD